ncbi:hypothetical protein NC651_008895 [Populus alba x Populus x berolinensis]|nr:hypothetical protein NC651_008895 [Populus alba x Populus x berolinensis]
MWSLHNGDLFRSLYLGPIFLLHHLIVFQNESLYQHEIYLLNGYKTKKAPPFESTLRYGERERQHHKLSESMHGN